MHQTGPPIARQALTALVKDSIGSNTLALDAGASHLGGHATST